MIHAVSFRIVARLAAVAVCLGASGGRAAAAQTPQVPEPRLVVTVVDQTGGVLPGATVTLAGAEPGTAAVAMTAVTTEAGVARFGPLSLGRYSLQVDLTGFVSSVVRELAVSGAETRQLVTLQLSFSDQIDVGDPQGRALSADGPAFSTFLTREMIEALPDDPDEMAAVLLSMAPPGATIFVDGFSGGALPPKYLIRSIRVPRMDNMAAQYHGSGDFLRIEIQTVVGAGPLRGRVNTAFFDDAFAAGNPFTPVKGEERSFDGGFSLAGTLVPGRLSFSLNANGSSEYTSPNLLAVLPDGTTEARALRRPGESRAAGVRLDYALNPDHALRVSLDRRSSYTRNLGTGGFNLESRAYETESRSHVLRVAENGPLGERVYIDSRLELVWSSNESRSALELPAVRVVGAFTDGGAQETGGQEAVSVDLGTDVDYLHGAHAWRVGVRVEGGRFTSDDTTNYLGTWTFPSLDAFNAGRPSNYTRRIGDPRITYSAWRTGVYLQDDWRAGRSVLISMGLRAGFQTLGDDAVNLSPRFTIGWAPFGDGGATVRASYGYLYDWIPNALFKQTQLVDGFRLRELNVVAPSYPDPPSAGQTTATNRYLWSDDLELPTDHRLVLGASGYLSPNQQLTVTYTYGRGLGLLRGRNLNTPVDGARPDPDFANVVELVSDASARSHAVTLGWNLTKAEWRRLILLAGYTWMRSETNTTGAFALPASGDDLEAEWGPDAPTHQGNASMNIRVFDHGDGSGLGLGLNVQARSGTPYNITTGHDDNLDGVFNDRPAGVGRNSARAASAFSLNGALNYAWRFGEPRVGPNGVAQQVPRYVIAWSLNFNNLINRDNFVGYSGVQTSPLFGQPTNVANPRRVQLSMRFDF